MSTDAANVMPPLESGIEITSVTAGSASAALSPTIGGGSRYMTIIVDNGTGTSAAFYYTLKQSADPAAPSPTSTSGTGRCFFQPANQPLHLRMGKGTRIRLYVVGSGTHYVRMYVSSPGA